MPIYNNYYDVFHSVCILLFIGRRNKISSEKCQHSTRDTGGDELDIENRTNINGMKSSTSKSKLISESET